MTPPVIVLGVGRSGTTLLRVMLDRSSELAIPYETFFVPQLAHRHGKRPNLDHFLDDLGRLRTLYDWGIAPDDVRPRLREGMTTSEAIAAIFETYAERQGKPRWGDKTPLYMQQLPLLEIPEGEVVRFNLTSPDVVHAFWVPEFLFKRDVIPGHPNHFQITATQTGTFTGHCSELCGLYHSRMLFTLKIVTPAQFKTFIAQQQAIQKTASGSTT